MFKVASLVCVCILGIQTTVCAGVVFDMETTFPTQTERPPRIDSMMAEGNKLKMTMNGAENKQSAVIYRGDREEILLINNEDHTWRAMDKATMINLGQHINPAMEKMQEMLKNMPPEQRARMEKMFARQGVSPGILTGKIDIQVRNTGETKTINGYPCVKYETWQKDEQVAEHWVTDWKRIPGSQEAQAVFQNMAAFSREIGRETFKGGGGPALFFESIGKMDGYPVLTRIMSDGKIMTESRLIGVKKKQIAVEEFDPPTGYVKKDFLPKSTAPHPGKP